MVLPAVLARDSLFVDGLAVRVIEQFARSGRTAQRVHPGDAKTAFEAMQGLCWDPPATISDLLTDPETAGTFAVLSGADLSDTARGDLPVFLEKVERASRSLPDAQRLTLITIGSRHQLPLFAGGATSEVTLASVWFWGRIARWDVAAHIAAAMPTGDRGVLNEVRSETIVEVAAWDIDAAEYLVENWSGDPAHIENALSFAPSPAESVTARWGALATTETPPTPILEAWDSRAADVWHERVRLGTAATLADSARLKRLVWSAQARVLLPWIEQHRDRLHKEVRNVLGSRYRQQVQRVLPDHDPSGLIEIGPLQRLIRANKTLQFLSAPARELTRSRNALAHLRPLSLSDQHALIEHCTELN
ncbi:hypothetical protein [Nocardia gamkensis]|uniref:hypothetical protein n=1 Tax=Nocardia gamkensis TaxID=352869 RepID=UPI0037C5060C